MGKAPAVIIITRHGARLDAEDRSWQGLSTEPYDSPLSYGGWTQTRALGARIAGILSTRDVSSQPDENAAARADGGAADQPRRTESGSGPSQRKRKQKIVIHTSPFLRCVQSSIAISAGIAQFLGNQNRPQAPPQPRYPRNRLFSPARSHSLDQRGVENRYAPSARKNSSSESSELGLDSPSAVSLEKPLLRVDALLGEWLSPSYYESIAPPPPSANIVASAKVELLRSAETIQGVMLASETSSVIPSDAEQDPIDESSSTPFSAADLLNALPESMTAGAPRYRDSLPGGSRRRARSNSNSELAHDGYSPPVPTYALSIAEPIPAGFVAHARDACVNIDSAWDSMSEPQNWGDGGEYGEEWSAMHVRFRNGLVKLVSWYKEHGLPSQSVDEDDDEDDVEDDIILIIVTHNAGCNALIGGLTNQPTLIEAGTGSLTMAVKKDVPLLALSPTPSHRRTSSSSSTKRSAIALAVHEEYEMRVVASMDHLKAGTDLMKMPLMQSTATMQSIAEHSETDKPRRNSALGSIRRRPGSSSSSAQVKVAPSLSVGTSTQATGLWGGRKGSIGVETLEEEEQSLGQGSALTLSDALPDATSAVLEDVVSPLESGGPLPQSALGRSASQRGLWGGGGGGRTLSQRRWTLSERPNSIGQ